MSAPRPDWVTDQYGTSYEDIVKSWGYDVDAFETFGSYQGDHLALLRRGADVGLVVFGYGSCSGCDALEAVTPWTYDDEEADWSQVIKLRDQLGGEVHWEPSRDALRDWIDAHPENHWWAWDDEIARWVNSNLGTSLRQVVDR